MGNVVLIARFFWRSFFEGEVLCKYQEIKVWKVYAGSKIRLYSFLFMFGSLMDEDVWGRKTCVTLCRPFYLFLKLCHKCCAI